jgi:nicotinamide-nucleotide amidase
MFAVAILAKAIITEAERAGLKIATAESCTGGLVSAALTDIAGSSAVLDRGFVTYSNEAKTEMLGVDASLIQREGAVSENVARAMAEGALNNSRADLTIAITGIAGPGGGSPTKPVGLVHFATARKHQATHHSEKHFGELGREEVRNAALLYALDLLKVRLASLPVPFSTKPNKV